MWNALKPRKYNINFVCVREKTEMKHGEKKTDANNAQNK